MDCIIKTTIICLLLAIVAAESPRGDLQKRVEILEKRYEHEAETLKEEYGRKIADLEKRVVQLETTNERLAEENDLNRARIDSLTRLVDECNQGCNKGDERSNVEGGTIADSTGESTKKQINSLREHSSLNNGHKRALGDGLNIAFTAYVDHDLNNQGPNQVLVFNKVLLNHGSGYNNYTGVFTVPVSGVYSFSFFIGQRDVNQFMAQLVVNNQHMMDAVCETLHATQDLQGGNSANLMVSQGDRVFIKHRSNFGTHVEGDDGRRITSFSGFLVYPVEPVAVVGK